MMLPDLFPEAIRFVGKLVLAQSLVVCWLAQGSGASPNNEQLPTWKQVGQIGPHERLAQSQAFSGDGKLLLTLGEDRIGWDRPDGKTLRTAKLWEVSNKKEKTTINTGNMHGGWAELSPDGKHLAIAGAVYDGPLEADHSNRSFAIRVWDIEKNTVKSTLNIERRGVNHFFFSRDGKKLISDSGPDEVVITREKWKVEITKKASTHEVLIWDVATGKKEANLKGHEVEIRSIALSSDGKSLATGDADGVIKIWDWASHKETLSMHAYTNKSAPRLAIANNNRAVDFLSFSPDGKELVSGREHDRNQDDPRTVVVWNLEKGQEIGRYRPRAGTIYGLAYSPDGRFVAVGSKDGVDILDAKTFKKVAVCDAEGAAMQGLAFSPDSKYLATAEGKTVRLWQVPPKQEEKKRPEGEKKK